MIRQRIAGASSLTRGAVVARVAILLVGILAALAFWQVSGTLNDQPPATPFPGWLAVLQPARTASTSSQVELLAVALQPGTPSEHPALSYSVVACGTRPFQGVLLIGGDARLSKPRALPPAGTSLSRIPNAAISDPGAGQLIPLGTIQALRFALPPTPCTGHFPPGHEASGITGTSVEIAGLAKHSVTQLGRFELWDGPRSTQSWPLIGSPPGINPNDLGEWTIAGVPGSWSRPFAEYMRLDAGSLTTIGSLEAADPALTDPTRLSWASTSSFQASARVLDSAALSKWQDWLVIATIVLTLAGSLLTAALFDLVPPLRTKRRDSEARPHVAVTNAAIVQDSRAANDIPSEMAQSRRNVAVAITLGAICAWVLARRPQRR
jgi:hypothetical protein